MIIWLKMKIISKYGTQRAFARVCGKSENWVSEIVLGIKKASPEEERLIMEKLGVDLADKLVSQG